MGIYDRDYYRQERPAFAFPRPRTVVGGLVLVNAAVYLVGYLFTGDDPRAVARLESLLELTPRTLLEPWHWWQLLTYGFTHHGLQHVFFNMLGLWFLGPSVEEHYGSKEFLRFYLATIVFAGLVWAGLGLAFQSRGSVVGASGAIVAVTVLFALSFPHRTVLFMFLFPMPAWVLGAMIVGLDLWNSLAAPRAADGPQVAYLVHLAGALFAFLYFRQGWNLGRLSSLKFVSRRLWRPRLRLHEPEEDSPTDAEGDRLGREVDRILAKISREGEASLTRKERRTLEDASRQYQKKRRAPSDSEV